MRAIIQVESDFDHLARSSKGAQGLMQLMPATARALRASATPSIPRQNIFGGVQYLRFLLDMFGGDVTLAAAAYNAGENAVIRYNGVPPYRETRGYVGKIQAAPRRRARPPLARHDLLRARPRPSFAGKQNASRARVPPLAEPSRRAR